MKLAKHEKIIPIIVFCLSVLFIPASALIVSLLFFHRGMDNWPYISLPDYVWFADRLTVTMESSEYNLDDPYEYDDELREYLFYSEDREAIRNMYEGLENLHFSPKTVKADLTTYTNRVLLEFERKNSTFYTFEFYEKGMFNGYFIFDGEAEIYAFRGDFFDLIYWMIEDAGDSYVRIY